MYRNLLLCCLLLGSFTCFAQTQPTTTIRGVVRDTIANTPLEFATVSVKTQAGDIKGYATTTENGSFEIKNILQGSYILEVAFVGYTSPARTIRASGGVLNVGTIGVAEERQRLDEVVVTAVGNAMIAKKDTIEYNASSYKVTEGAMLEDLVKKLPGAEIDSDGKITVNGKEIKKVMIDGKTFFSDDPQIATKNLPANMISKVQVVDRKSDQARFTGIDDGNEETVLNLTVKPGMKNGWFGNVMAGAGYQDKYQGGGMVSNLKDDRQFSIIASGNNTNNRGFNDFAGNMMQQGRGGGGGQRGGSGGGYNVNVGGTRMSIGGNGITTSWLGGVNAYDEFGAKKNLKISGNYFYNGAETEINQSRTRQNIFRNDSTSYYFQNAQSNTQTQGHRAAFEMEWTIDSLNSIIFKPNVSYGIGDFDERSDYATTLASLVDTVNKGYSISSGDNTSISFTGDVLFRHKFKKQGRTFSANFVFGYSNNLLDGTNYSQTFLYENSLVSSIDTIDQKYHTDNYSYTTNTRLAYTEPLGNNYYAEIAYGIRTKSNNSDKETFDNDGTGSYSILNDEYSNYYKSLFVNQQADLSIRSVRTKYSWTLGVSAQPSYLHSENRKDQPLSRHSFNISPNGNFIYNFSETKQFRADYRGRTNEPSISQLQPVPDNSNPLLERIGNPDLDPEFTNNIRLSYRNTNMQAFRTMFSFLNVSVTSDKIVNNTIYESSTGKQLIIPTNVGGIFSAMGSFMLMTPFAKGSKFSVMTNTFASFFQNASLSNTIDVLDPNDIINIARNSTKSTTRSLSVNEMLRLSYRGSKIDINLTGRAGYSKAWYSLDSKEQPTYWNNAVGGDFTWSLPWDFSLASDANYTFYIGYPDGYNEPSFVWNAEISKLLFKKKQGTIKVKVFDILNESRGNYRTTTDNYIEDSSVNTLGRYVMCSFIYRFGSFGGGTGGNRQPGFRGPGAGAPRIRVM